MIGRRYSKKNYVQVARIIRGAYRTFDGGEAVAYNSAFTVITYFKAQFAKEFHDDNSAFDLERFNEECNP